MLRKTFKILIIISVLLVSLSLLKIDQEEVLNTIKIEKKVIEAKTIREEKPIGKIIIKKINLEKDLYDKNSSKNNIEENVTILNESVDPSLENSIMFIAAHSGTSNVSYFNDLDKLELKDEIELIYNNETYLYQINRIDEQPKDGYISGVKENKRQLVLTTCCPNKDNCQLIINGLEKESY